MFKFFTTCILSLLLILGFVNFPLAETIKFEDWELVCESKKVSQTQVSEVAIEQENKKQKTACRLQQAQAIKDNQKIVFVFNIIKKAKKMVAVISTPLGVYIPQGIQLKIDKGKAQVAGFETCNVNGCHGGFYLNSKILGQLKRGNILMVTLHDTKNKPITIKVSLKGITAGIKALNDR